MDATPYIARVRRILQDYTDTHHAGTFWLDYYVLLALGQAQNIVINTLLRIRNHHALRYLVSSVDGTSPVTLPSDYLHYISAVIGDIPDGDIPRTARLYLGAEGVPYLYVAHDGCVILGGNIIFLDNGDATKEGRLYYYKRPAAFVRPGDAGFSNTQEFDLHIYDMMMNVAVRLLGQKDTNNQRDIKKAKRIALATETEGAMSMNPVLYPVDTEAYP